MIDTANDAQKNTLITIITQFPKNQKVLKFMKYSDYNYVGVSVKFLSLRLWRLVKYLIC